MRDYLEIIRDMRKDRGLNQTEMAAVLGTSQQHYSKYEKGEHELPARVLIQLADYHGVSVDYLLGRPYRKDDLTVLGSKVDAEHTAGEVLSDILSLSPQSRSCVLEYVAFQKMREAGSKE